MGSLDRLGLKHLTAEMDAVQPNARNAATHQAFIPGFCGGFCFAFTAASVVYMSIH